MLIFELIHEKEILKHKRALMLLKFIEKKENRLIDLRTSLQREENKPYIQSFLFCSREWFTNEIKSTELCIYWAIKRYKTYYS